MCDSERDFGRLFITVFVCDMNSTILEILTFLVKNKPKTKTKGCGEERGGEGGLAMESPRERNTLIRLVKEQSRSISLFQDVCHFF